LKTVECFANESPILRAVQRDGVSAAEGDTIHGKYLEEIVSLFFECGGFDMTRALNDAAQKLQSLVDKIGFLVSANSNSAGTQEISHQTPISKDCCSLGWLPSLAASVGATSTAVNISESNDAESGGDCTNIQNPSDPCNAAPANAVSGIRRARK
uniref:BTB/POZ domain-containing protein n=1 Tax=Gongylonema pulchrum TaxID=637853 RepID=A0A183D6P1_9BILA